MRPLYNCYSVTGAATTEGSSCSSPLPLSPVPRERERERERERGRAVLGAKLYNFDMGIMTDHAQPPTSTLARARAHTHFRARHSHLLYIYILISYLYHTFHSYHIYNHTFHSHTEYRERTLYGCMSREFGIIPPEAYPDYDLASGQTSTSIP